MDYSSQQNFIDDRIRAAAVYCSDGRFCPMIDEFLHEHLHLTRYDRLAVPGGAAALAGRASSDRGDQALEQLRFLVDVHELARVVLIAHEDCALYGDLEDLGPKAQHQRQLDDLRAAAARVAELRLGLEAEAYFARIDGDRIIFVAC